MGTVTLYGLTALPVARLLGLRGGDDEAEVGDDGLDDEPDRVPPAVRD
ncbi:hypothetical protein BH24ACT4_BH24ACT4_09860 [soil metagenome]